MTQSYSVDLRVRVVAFVEAGHTCRAAARHFGVSDSFAIKLCSARGSPVRPLRRARAGRLATESFRLIPVGVKADSFGVFNRAPI